MDEMKKNEAEEKRLLQEQEESLPAEGGEQQPVLQVVHKGVARGWRLLAICLILLLIGQTIALFFLDSGSRREIGGARFRAKSQPVEAQLEKMGKVFQILKQNYYHELSDEQIWEAMVAGTASHVGSRFTTYMPKEVVDAFREGVSGQYYGIGATVQQDAKAGTMTLVSIQEGTPAAEAGLRDGDILLQVDGQDVSVFQNPTELANAVKGPEGSQVKISIRRPSEENKEYRFTVTRAEIHTISVVYHMMHSEKGTPVGYVRVREFTETLEEQLTPALEALVAEGAKCMVLDLRNNPGGDAAAMSAVLDDILPAGLIARIEGRHDGKAYVEEWKTEDEVRIPADVRFAILLNENSASASEFFSGALRDRGRAILVGKKTFGKGVATQTYGLPDGSAVNVTTFEYILPEGEHVEVKGLSPDIEVDLPKKAYEYGIEEIPYEYDTQLQEAVRVLLEA